VYFSTCVHSCYLKKQIELADKISPTAMRSSRASLLFGLTFISGMTVWSIAHAEPTQKNSSLACVPQTLRNILKKRVVQAKAGLSFRWKTFSTEYQAMGPQRLLRAPRKQGGESIWQDWLFHPFATAFDRPYRASFLTSSVALSLVFNAINKPIEKSDDEIVEMAKKRIAQVPGEASGFQYVEFGLIPPREWAQEVIDHDRYLGNWSKQSISTELELLPRIQDFERDGIITHFEAIHLNRLAWHSLHDSITSFGTKNYAEEVTMDLAKRIAADPVLSRRDPRELLLIATALWTPHRVNGQTESMIWSKVFGKRKEQSGSNGQIFKKLDELEKQEKLSVLEVLKLAALATDHSDVVQKAIDEASKPSN
jgi:hypothetical protein